MATRSRLHGPCSLRWPRSHYDGPYLLRWGRDVTLPRAATRVTQPTNMITSVESTNRTHLVARDNGHRTDCINEPAAQSATRGFEVNLPYTPWFTLFIMSCKFVCASIFGLPPRRSKDKKLRTSRKVDPNEHFHTLVLHCGHSWVCPGQHPRKCCPAAGPHGLTIGDFMTRTVRMMGQFIM